MEITKEDIDNLKKNFGERFSYKLTHDSYKNFLPDKPLNEILKKVNYSKPELSYVYLTRLNRAIEKSIERGASDAIEIYHGMPVFARDLMIELKGKSKTELNDMIESLENEKGKQALCKKVMVIVDELKNIPREKLLSLEATKTKTLEKSLAVFPELKAKGEIKGDINKGIFGMSQTRTIEKLRANGAEISRNAKLTEYMSDDLLKYKIAVLTIADTFCDKSKIKAKNRESRGFSGKVSYYDYNYMRRRTEDLSRLAKETYENIYGKTPLKEISETIYGGQTTIKGIFPDRDKVL